MKALAGVVVVAVGVVAVGVVGSMVILFGGYSSGSAASAAAATSLGGDPCVPATGPSADLPDLTPEQSKVATEAIRTGVALDVPPKGLVILIATGFQESGLRNLDGGDRDSKGWLQQRPSTGWGTTAQVRDVALATRAFFGRADHTNNPGLYDIAGWEGMEVWEAAQAVQRSAFPQAYAKWEGQATAVVNAVLETEDVTAVATCDDADPMVAQCPRHPNIPEGGLTPDAILVARCAVSTFGPMVVGGIRNDPGSFHHTGQAVDLMVPLTTAGRARGDRIAAWVRSNAKSLGVSEVIWHDRIWTVARNKEGWRPYVHSACSTAAGCSPTLAHRDHVHVSVYGNAAVAPKAARGPWVLPTRGYTLTARYGQCSALWSACHTGLDFAASSGTAVVAASAGVVSSVGWGGAYGNLIKIDHGGGVETRYAHLLTATARQGQRVTAGATIGYVGSTGNSTGAHLHFEVLRDDQHTDPMAWLTGHGVNP